MREYGKGINYVSMFITLSVFSLNFVFVLFLCYFFVFCFCFCFKKSFVSILSIISTANVVIIVSVIISIIISVLLLVNCKQKEKKNISTLLLVGCTYL